VTTFAPAPPRTRARPAPARVPARTPSRVAVPRRAAADARTRAAAQSRTSGRLAALLVVGTVAALVLAVVFHVFLAQRQMQLDQLNVRIEKAQRTYEENHLQASMLSSPQHIIEEAQRLGLATPAEPAQYLSVDGAKLPVANAGEPSTTLSDYGKVKKELGSEQP
jgi:cell division protein FtsL